MRSNSSKISYYLQYDYSPMTLSKYKPFNDHDSIDSQFIDFSVEKNRKTPEFKEAQVSISLLSFKKITDSNMPSIDIVKETSIDSKNLQKVPNIIFTSKIFKPIPIIKQTTFRKKIFYHKDHSPLKTVSINEIIVNGHQLKSFPFIHCNNDQIQLNLSETLISRKKYFLLSQPTKYHQRRHYYFPADKLKKIKLTESQLHLNNITNFMPGETDPSNIINKFYNDIKNVLLLHQKYHSLRRKKIYKEKASLELEKLISNCNIFTDYIKNVYACFRNTFIVHKSINEPVYTISSVRKKRPLYFKCLYCKRKYYNGQALGGHISQSHPKQSTKYQKKIEIRNNRARQRNAVNESRKILLLKYNYDYDTLIKDKANKDIIGDILKKHKSEYKKLILKIKKEAQAKSEENDSIIPLN